MKLLVTGGLGFIGSNFILHVLENHKQFNIINLDAMLYGSNIKNLAEVQNHSNYEFVNGNITNFSLIQKLILKCDIVVNFAAESFVDRSISNAEPFFESNIKGVFTILQIIKEQKKQLIHISTDEVFGSLKNDSATEESKFNPSSPYAATKAAAELLVNSYVVTHGCNCLITRCTNNYGPRQYPEKLIPKIILLAHKNKKIPIYGSGKNIRDWIFVQDHCEGIMNALIHGKQGESYNISANNEIDNLTLVEKILSIMDKSSDLIEFVEDRPGHDFRYSLDSSKIRNKLNWLPKTNFEEGITKTINWYLSNNYYQKETSKKTLAFTPWKN